MEGDVEKEPYFFIDQPEERTLTVTARTSADGKWTDEAVEAVAHATGDFLRLLASSIVISAVTCEHSGIGDGAALRIRSVLEGTEAPLHEAAALMADMVGDLPGVEQSVGAVSWHISAPPSFEGSGPMMLQ